MASVKQTSAGNWYAVHGVTGKIIKGQPRSGHGGRREAKRWAVNNIPGISSMRDVNTF
jgi:hypothetical protein